MSEGRGESRGDHYIHTTMMKVTSIHPVPILLHATANEQYTISYFYYLMIDDTLILILFW